MICEQMVLPACPPACLSARPLASCLPTHSCVCMRNWGQISVLPNQQTLLVNGKANRNLFLALATNKNNPREIVHREMGIEGRKKSSPAAPNLLILWVLTKLGSLLWARSPWTGQVRVKYGGTCIVQSYYGRSLDPWAR